MKRKILFATVAAILLALSVMAASAQATLGKVNGRILDGGKPLAGAQVVFTFKDNGRQYKGKTDKGGTFSMLGLTRGIYELEIFSPTGESLFKSNAGVINEGGVVDEYLVDVKDPSNAKTGLANLTSSGGGPAKPTKEQQAQREAQEKEKTAVEEHNKKAQGENTLIAQLNPAMQAKQWDVAEPLLQQLITINPSRWEYQQALGNAQFSLGKYEEAVATFEKTIPLAQNAASNPDAKDTKMDPAKAKSAVAQMLTNEGNSYLKLKKNPEAIAAFTKAAELDPNPGTAYFNLCATQYNTGNVDGALVSCDKAIAADPNKADAYYIKGSLLIGSGKMDKDNKFIAPPGSAEALNKYLELAPDGAHAADVKQMLAFIGSKVETSYGEKKKKK
jgi:tetratricopeptide (TPR) repeat protein